MKVKSLLLSAIFVASCAIAAMAQDAPAASKPGITPYASLRVFIGADYSDAKSYDDSTQKTSSYQDVDMRFQQLVNSRMGFNFKGGKLAGKVELGLKDKGASAGYKTVYMRHFFVTYTSGDFQFLVGQTDAPFHYFSILFDGVGWSGNGYGNCAASRATQLKFAYKGLYIDFMQPSSADYSTSDDVAMSDYDVYYPITTIGYDYKADGLSIGALVTGYKFNPTISGSKEDYLCYLGQIHGQVNFAPAYVRFNVTYAQNPNQLGIDTNAGITGLNGAGNISADYDTTAGHDNHTISGQLELGSKIGNGIASVIGGYVYNTDTKADRMCAGIQYRYNLESYLKLIPTVLYLNDLKGYDSTNDKTYDQGSELLAGVIVRADI